jgi:hypothetical protein
VGVEQPRCLLLVPREQVPVPVKGDQHADRVDLSVDISLDPDRALTISSEKTRRFQRVSSWS